MQINVTAKTPVTVITKNATPYEVDGNNDLEELNRNLLNMSQQNAKKANKLLDRLKISKSEDRLRKTVKKLSGR